MNLVRLAGTVFSRVKVLTVALTYFMMLFDLVLRGLCQIPFHILSGSIRGERMMNDERIRAVMYDER
jgi:hypothetical protein